MKIYILYDVCDDLIIGACSSAEKASWVIQTYNDIKGPNAASFAESEIEIDKPVEELERQLEEDLKWFYVFGNLSNKVESLP